MESAEEESERFQAIRRLNVSTCPVVISADILFQVVA
jgi:hypothetical protein